MKNSAENNNASPDLFRQRRGVYMIDRLAEGMITLGGMGVIVAVLGIIAYLLWVVIPLALPGSVEQSAVLGIKQDTSVLAIDEYQRLAAIIDDDGALRAYSIDSGMQIGEPQLLGGFLAISHSPASGLVAMGFADGSLRVTTAKFGVDIHSAANAPEQSRGLEVGQQATIPGGIVERTGEDQFRSVVFEFQPGEPITNADSSSQPVAIDADVFGKDRVLAVVREDSTGSVLTVTTKRSLVGGNTKTKIKELPIELEQSATLPGWAILLDDGKEVMLIWANGQVKRYSKTKTAFVLSETVSVISEGESVSVAEPLLGRGTILIGTTHGSVYSWMLTRGDQSEEGARKLVRVRTFHLADNPVTAISVSLRDRTFIAGDSEGEIRLWHATSGKLVGEAAIETDHSEIAAVAISPKLDGFYAATNSGVSSWQLDPGHPNATLESLFLPVWYEGDQSPSYVYQSTAAEDSAESKLSLTPLIFGTFKATIFAMLFAIPVAVMASIYTSEFMSRQMRSKIKPTVEMMASLPSVVLGFIAAMILAPFVRDHLSSVLVGLVLLPMCLLISSSLWPLLPNNLAWRLPQPVQLVFILLACLIGVFVSAWAGPVIDNAMFSLHEHDKQILTGFVEPASELPEWAAKRTEFTLSDRNRLRQSDLYVLDDVVVQPIDLSDSVLREQFEERRKQVLAGESPFKLWLTGMVGSPLAGWLALLFVPALAISGMIGMSVGRKSGKNWAPLVRVLGVILFALPVSYLLAMFCTSIGLDARESVLGSFTQRNTFVVGIIMGFAVIPIIFTISEDAMQSVPNALRSASLGAGATTWQTTMRIVLPVAASGIFSAIMIGLGRAAGETMIVLMATGNTPVMDWNIFGGLRTLSANIAVELPEAESGGTHYRVLFLCGVVLFAITFVVNTTAEIIRQHFRKRSALL